MTAFFTAKPAAALLCVIFLVVYLPDVGHGFLRDDYSWIAGSRLQSISELPKLFSGNVGFYRPLVSTSFALDYSIWHLNSFGYAVTNLLVLGVDAVLLFALLRRFALPVSAALVGAAVWVFNFHAVNMALLWISGRTALLLCLFALAGAHAYLARRFLLTGLAVLAALLCKEEAVLLPALFFAFEVTERREGPLVRRFGAALVMLWPLWTALAIYAVLRVHSGAFGPGTAPDYYRFTVEPLRVLRNLREYLDRAATWPAVVGLLVGITAWNSGRFDDAERRAARFGLIWFVSLYGLTMFLPVRSSLYALAPSIGSALIVGGIASRTWRSRRERFRRLSVALLVVIVALIPVYRTRNLGWVPAADLASNVLAELRLRIPASSTIGRVIVVDQPSAGTTLSEAFWTAFPEATHLFIGPGWAGEVVDSLEKLPDLSEEDALVFEVRDGHLVPPSNSEPLN